MDDINEQEAPPVPQRNRSFTKKTNFKARLRVKRRGRKWHVTMFIEDHNHPCIKKFSLKRYLRSHRGIPREEKEFIKLLHKVNLSAGRIMTIMAEIYGRLGNVPYVKEDVSNYMAKLDDVHTHKDIESLIEHFERIKLDDPLFMYKIHSNYAGNADRIFWVDGAAREAYKLYNDCLSFDTTYMTNMYNMPFAPFSGINRYCQSIQLGHGFLSTETIADFVWLFEAFLEAMDGVQPVNFITDQCVAMKSAILVTFTGTCHRNSYFRDRFYPFLQTTTRSEGFNAVLKKYVNPHNSITHFFQQYLKVQEKIDVAEDEGEFEIEDSILRPWSDYPMEQQALEVYTRNIYLRLRVELRRLTSYNAIHLGGQMFDVVPIKESVYLYGRRSYRAEANSDEETYKCECSKFNRDGILCCHIMRIMVQLGKINSIPAQYILPRWTAPDDVLVAQKVQLTDMPTDRKLTNKEKNILYYGTLCNDWTDVAKIAATSDKAKALADKYMQALTTELKSLKIAESAKRKTKKKAKASDGGTHEA
ncbi:unnamed protein product [Alopecurus aequalis]